MRLLWPFLIGFTLALAAPRHALPHDSAQWIQDGQYKDANGISCCGPQDCKMIDDYTRIVRGGYHVDMVWDRWVDGEEIVNETVPYDEATPTTDGHFWMCRSGRMRKCFFAPPFTN